ncbi:MAG: sugar phosphate isomerase/epimerase, partial [Clostridia bacterium]|nr:sugar phosphate isomerase/epimerase [Clostridia bacterium]
TVLYDMLPPDLRITGHRVSAGDLHAWLESSFLRAKALGTDIVVLDAAASRHVPNGYDFSLARRQLGNFLRMVQGHAASAGLKVAVQNLRRAECNLINTVSEAALVPALLHLDNVGVLADTVQMERSSEPFDSIVRSGEALLHVHAGNALDRTLPAPGDGEDYVRLFRQLRQMNYHGGVSCVAEKPFTKEEAKRALDYMKFARTEV